MSENEVLDLPLGRNIDLALLCKSDSSYSLTLPRALFSRLEQSCAGIKDDPRLEVHFYQDLQGLNTIEGSISVTLSLVCERCLQPFDLKVQSSFKSTCDLEKARSLRLEDKLDIVDLDENGQFALYDYLEDCLLLELPLVPRHEDEAQCGVKGQSWSFGHDSQEPQNPFAQLKQLKFD